jgi:hypothetical protein
MGDCTNFVRASVPLRHPSNKENAPASSLIFFLFGAMMLIARRILILDEGTSLGAMLRLFFIMEKHCLVQYGINQIIEAHLT